MYCQLSANCSLIPRLLPTPAFGPQSWGGASGYELGENMATTKLRATIHIFRFSYQENLQHSGSSYGWGKEAWSKLWWANTEEWDHTLTEGTYEQWKREALRFSKCIPFAWLSIPFAWNSSPHLLVNTAKLIRAACMVLAETDFTNILFFRDNVVQSLLLHLSF